MTISGFSVSGAIPRSSATTSGSSFASRSGVSDSSAACAACKRGRPPPTPCPSRASPPCAAPSPRPARSASNRSPRTVASSSAGSASAPNDRITTASASTSRSFAMPCADETPPGTSTNRTWAATVFFGALHLGEDGEPGIGDGHDRDVGLTAVRARAGQGREQGRLPGERHADQPDVLHERRAYQPVAARRTGRSTDRTASPAGGGDIGRSARKLRPFGQCCNGRRLADVTYETRRWRGAARPTPPRRVLLSVWLVWLIPVWSSCGRAGIRRPRPSAVSCTVGNRTRPGRTPRPRVVLPLGSAYDFVAQKIFAISSTAFSSS